MPFNTQGINLLPFHGCIAVSRLEESDDRQLQRTPMNDQSKIEHFIERIVAGASQAQLEIESKELDLNNVGIRGRTPLMVSAAEGLLAAVETLVRNGASVHALGRGEITALHEASANGEAAVANYLLSLGADVNAETADGVTPLMCAAAWGNTEVAKLLLENHADLTKTDRTGATAADIAREKGEGGAADLINSYLSRGSP
ncbi:ankyrin repeat domain-containing protein [Rhizobium leguminosarum]|uniref:ankyrin repeat domain-containing protein n=1 Tax=Rhizobium leguminosarum TaxID=384 RepID=UPI0021BBC768|nr:ankyrin repeat domain-containing protein [Rhizobium leguminosarum]